MDQSSVVTQVPYYPPGGQPAGPPTHRASWSSQQSSPPMSHAQTEDLKAFERRLTEVIEALTPVARWWQIILTVSTVCVVVTAWRWLMDPSTSSVVFSESVSRHPLFALTTCLLLLLFLVGIHKRVVAPSIIASRVRIVLADFNMSCDDTGKLILKPRPA